MNTSNPRPTLLLLGAIAAFAVACKAAPPPTETAAEPCAPPLCVEIPEWPPCDACFVKVGQQVPDQAWTLTYHLESMEDGPWSLGGINCRGDDGKERPHMVFGGPIVGEPAQTGTATIARLDSECCQFQVTFRQAVTISEDGQKVTHTSDWLTPEDLPEGCNSPK